MGGDMHALDIDNYAQLVGPAGTFFAAITSIVSIFVAVAALKVQRNHNFKSVLPIPQILIGDYENRLFVSIENAGVGPLIIRDVQVRSKATGKKTSSLIDFMPELPQDDTWDTFIARISGRAIPAQQSVTILQYSGPFPGRSLSESESLREALREGNLKAYARSAVLRDRIRAALKDLTIAIKTSDIYGKNLPDCERDLESFGRRIGMEQNLISHAKAYDGPG